MECPLPFPILLFIRSFNDKSRNTRNKDFQGSSLTPSFEVHSPCRAPSEFQWRSILLIFPHKEDLTKSEPLEELQGSSSEHPHEVHSSCRVPLEPKLRSTPHYFLYRMIRGVPQERHSLRFPLEELLRSSVE